MTREQPGRQPSGREPEGASFAGRVAGRRGRPPTFVLVFLAAVASLVVVGVGGRAPATPATIPAPATQSAAAAASAPPASIPRVIFETTPPRATPAPILTSPDGPIVLKARRHPETMYVHGDVFVDRVTWVFVNLQDAAGRVAGWASVSVPGAAGPGVDEGPTLRFDVELAVPDDFRDGILFLQANAYDSSGKVIATTRLPIQPDGQAGTFVPGVAPVGYMQPGAGSGRNAE